MGSKIDVARHSKIGTLMIDQDPDNAWFHSKVLSYLGNIDKLGLSGTCKKLQAFRLLPAAQETLHGQLTSFKCYCHRNVRPIRFLAPQNKVVTTFLKAKVRGNGDLYVCQGAEESTVELSDNGNEKFFKVGFDLEKHRQGQFTPRLVQFERQYATEGNEYALWAGYGGRPGFFYEDVAVREMVRADDYTEFLSGAEIEEGTTCIKDAI
ncbi:MAG: hypothetical protein SGARI_003995 [Bacillariaceae sp.]